MKKILSITVAILLILSTFLSTYADTAVTVNGEHNVKAGDIVTYSVRINDLSGKVFAINANVLYDEELLSLISGGFDHKAFEFGSALSSVMFNEALENRFLFNCANGAGYFPFDQDNLVIRLSFLVNEPTGNKTDAELDFEFLEIYNTDTKSLVEGTDFTLEKTVEINVYEGDTETVDKSKGSVNAPENNGEDASSATNGGADIQDNEGGSSSVAVIVISGIIVVFLIAIVAVLLLGKKKVSEDEDE